MASRIHPCLVMPSICQSLWSSILRRANPCQGSEQCSITSCAITRCREIMTPQLSIVKTRFAKAPLRPRVARHRSWNSTCRLPNRRAGTLSYPMLAWDTQRPHSRGGSSSFLIPEPGRPSAIPTDMRSTQQVGCAAWTFRGHERLPTRWSYSWRQYRWVLGGVVLVPVQVGAVDVSLFT